jgi:UDP-N-acetylglucosamine 2-epimerase
LQRGAIVTDRLKVMTIVGTRPELIRLSRTIAALDRFTDHVLVHTGQNYDYELNEIFFEDLGIPRPDVHLNVETGSLGAVLGGVLVGTERALLEHRPDAVVVLGDTNSCIAAVMARRHQVPVYHLEAGNRSFDDNVPEEVNRRMVDHVADFNLAYTEHARRNLLAEGLHPSRVLVTGSPMREVLDHQAAAIESSQVLQELGMEERGYFLVSLHREENVDEPERLRSLVGALGQLSDEYDLPVLMSTHPRTRRRLDEMPDALFRRLQLHPPFGFSDYVKLQRSAFCVLSDSGTISEESSILAFPAVTLRTRIERPEALDAGAIITTGVTAGPILDGVRMVVGQHGIERGSIPPEYLVTNFSSRVVRYIRSTASQYHEVRGIRKRSAIWSER